MLILEKNRSGVYPLIDQDVVASLTALNTKRTKVNMSGVLKS